MERPASAHPHPAANLFIPSTTNWAVSTVLEPAHTLAPSPMLAARPPSHSTPPPLSHGRRSVGDAGAGAHAGGQPRPPPGRPRRLPVQRRRGDAEPGRQRLLRFQSVRRPALRMRCWGAGMGVGGRAGGWAREGGAEPGSQRPAPSLPASEGGRAGEPSGCAGCAAGQAAPSQLTRSARAASRPPPFPPRAAGLPGTWAPSSTWSPRGPGGPTSCSSTPVRALRPLRSARAGMHRAPAPFPPVAAGTCRRARRPARCSDANSCCACPAPRRRLDAAGVRARGAAPARHHHGPRLLRPGCAACISTALRSAGRVHAKRQAGRSLDRQQPNALTAGPPPTARPSSGLIPADTDYRMFSYRHYGGLPGGWAQRVGAWTGAWGS